MTSGRRTPFGNRLVGGVAGSHHLTGRAFDYLPNQGESWSQAIARGKRDYPGAEVFKHGDHVHVEGLPQDSIPLFGKRGTRTR
ncbi:D-Ala-D-Ala carboxypeptidase family metallohydrolase [Qipengyuania sp. MTN3-11]|uniref:D-Ala-D-Ala carboxypeptidase family metallohydrolase n=1 Tax=Qipengyuania sp. MTN3-11 TaxID=3056557 RepID=UPI0036F3B75C